MSTSFGPDLVCHPPGSPGDNVPELIDVKPQVLIDARHKGLCKNIKGKVTQIGAELIPVEVLIEWSLSVWRDHDLKDMKAVRANTCYSMSDTRKDMAAYTYLYHMPGGSNKEIDPF